MNGNHAANAAPRNSFGYPAQPTLNVPAPDQNRVEVEAKVIEAGQEEQAKLVEAIVCRLWPVLAPEPPDAAFACIGGEDDSISPLAKRMRGIGSRVYDTNRRLVSILARLEV